MTTNNAVLETKQPLSRFADPDWTAKGERRASVALKSLDTLWINTGTLCNIACTTCYIESSPRNDRLVYIGLKDVEAYLDEIARDRLGTTLIGLTGGEPFMNPDIIAIIETALMRGFEVLVLTNAMKPMLRHQRALTGIAKRHGRKFRLRVSLDDYREAVHDEERGAGSFQQALAGLSWLSQEGFPIEIAARSLKGEGESVMRDGFARLFAQTGLGLDAQDPVALVIFPEMTANANPPEISEACWGILNKAPDDVMCSAARMVVKRKGAERAAVVACTLLPYDAQFELGATLKEATGAVKLNHRFCATFCVLGGASCGAKKD